MRTECDSGDHRPRKRFGQHFLHDRTTIEAIIATIAARPDDHLVEIGPGEGVLTRFLIASGARLDAVELDRDLVKRLSARLGDAPNFALHQGDALAFDFAQLGASDRSLRMVGNLPYNISTPLLVRLLFDYGAVIRDMVFMLQREVVDRLAAMPRDRDYGRLSVMAQALCTVEPQFIVPPDAFRPPPKVMSAVVRLTPRETPFPSALRIRLEDLVKTAFAQRRKTLRHTLGKAVEAEILAECGIGLQQRAEEIPVATYVRLAELITRTASGMESH